MVSDMGLASCLIALAIVNANGQGRCFLPLVLDAEGTSHSATAIRLGMPMSALTRLVTTHSERMRMRPRLLADRLIILALRVAFQVTRRKDLAPHYKSLADFLESQLNHEFIDGDGI